MRNASLKQLRAAKQVDIYVWLVRCCVSVSTVRAIVLIVATSIFLCKPFFLLTFTAAYINDGSGTLNQTESTLATMRPAIKTCVKLSSLGTQSCYNFFSPKLLVQIENYVDK